MAGVEEQVAVSGGDKYRSFLFGKEEDNTVWRHGAPPTYHDVNLLFEQGRTKVILSLSIISLLCMCCVLHHHILLPFHVCVFVLNLQVWPERSLEETVQNAVKSWEMELSHKTRLQDFKSINPEKFKLFVNGIYIFVHHSNIFLTIL